MSAVVKMPLIKIEVSEGKKRKLYLVSEENAHAVETLLGQLDESDEGSVAAVELFPDLGDSPLAFALSKDFFSCDRILVVPLTGDSDLTASFVLSQVESILRV